jgi:hypothetical protein
MEIINDIPFTLDTPALLQRVHIHPGSEDAQEFEQLLHLARKIGKPKAIYTEAYVELLGDDSVLLNEIRFTSSMLRNNLTNIDRIFAYVATCGREMDQATLVDANILAIFWWDAIKESLLMAASKYLLGFLEYRYQLKKTASMNPGSGDVNVWPIEQQRELFALLGDVRGQIGVELTASCLMIPNKTVSGILFPTERDFRTCQVCHRKNCQNRKAPFNQALWESIQHEEKPQYESDHRK